MYDTGCRPSEMFIAHKWSILDSSTIKMQPSKGNDIRYIDKSHVDPVIWETIENGNIITSRLSMNTLKRYFQRFYPYRPTFVESANGINPIGMGLFRHFAFKRLYNVLEDYSLVGDYFGEIEVNNTIGYVNSDLYYTDY